MRLIDADKLEPINVPIAPVLPGDDICFKTVYLKSEVDEQPTIEKPTGKWIIDDLDEYYRGRVWKCHCSICDKDPLKYVSGQTNWWLYKTQMPKYCPHCGAEMIRTEKEKR